MAGFINDVAETNLEKTIERGFEAVAQRFERKSDEIGTLSNALTKLDADVGHLTKTMERLDKHIDNINLGAMRIELHNCQTEIAVIKTVQGRNSWWLLTSLIIALVGLLGFLGQVVWQKVNK